MHKKKKKEVEIKTQTQWLIWTEESYGCFFGTIMVLKNFEFFFLINYF